MITHNVNLSKRLDNFDIRTLGPTEALVILWTQQNHQLVFSAPQMRKQLDIGPAKLRQTLSRLTKKGWLIRLAKGRYLVVPMSVPTGSPYTGSAFLIGSALAGKPYYIGYWNMLNYYGYTEQLPRAVFVATQKKRRETVVHGVTYTFIRLSDHKFFGMREIEESGQMVTVSDREKTILDCLDHPEYCGGILESAKGVLYGSRDWDWNRIVEYIDRLGNSAAPRRLGFLMDFFQIGSREQQESLQRFLRSGYVLLDPLFPREGKCLRRWRLQVNVPEYSLEAIGKT
jgi:predicted transcriptional regulator of viral defense system